MCFRFRKQFVQLEAAVQERNRIESPAPHSDLQAMASRSRIRTTHSTEVNFRTLPPGAQDDMPITDEDLQLVDEVLRHL